jgi:hypothetical protein
MEGETDPFDRYPHLRPNSTADRLIIRVPFSTAIMYAKPPALLSCPGELLECGVSGDD